MRYSSYGQTDCIWWGSAAQLGPLRPSEGRFGKGAVELRLHVTLGETSCERTLSIYKLAFSYTLPLELEMPGNE